ncbi:AraC family transcriptional regulator [Delftia acidovorans]|uniref:AraC family transcriptional regulator n=1 Tax=Delftia acidovorans TaxID=80866 RepID=UPI00359FAD0D
MTTQRSSSAAWVRGILDMMATEGLAPQSLCAAADIDLAALQHSQARTDVDRVSRLWELAVAQSANPTLGLDRQLAARHGNIDLVGYSLASGPHLLAGFRDLERHMAVISDATSFTLERDARGYWLSIHHIGATRPVPRQRVEFAVLTLLVLCNWLTRRDVRPLAVEFMAEAPAPSHEAAYRAAFGLLPRFGEDANRFLLSEADLLAPIPTHNPELLALHEKLVETELDHLGQAGVGARVRHEIARLLPQGEPRREDVASLLGLTDRTLQRRLQAEDTSYQQLLDETRRELALQYLGEPRPSLAEVADLLGFVDQSNLFRACRRWFGMPPGQYRQQLRA